MGFNQGGRDFGERKDYKIICADCGKEGTVPFPPKEGRPAYCGECWPKHRPPRRF